MLHAIANDLFAAPTETLHLTAQREMLSRRDEPLFIAGWENVLMIHFEVDSEALQHDVPFELHLFDGRAFVSPVAFTMRNLRPCFGGRLAAWLLRPIATHDFLNIRTYVRHGGETGIHFLAEWLSNRLAVRLGPATFSLPYRYGHTNYHYDWQNSIVQGRVVDAISRDKFQYHGELSVPADFTSCEAGSLEEWLMERYIAFNSAGGRMRSFRVWHPPWQQCSVNAEIHDNELLKKNWLWFDDAHLISASFSQGFREVWMGRPHRISESNDKRSNSPALSLPANPISRN